MGEWISLDTVEEREPDIIDEILRGMKSGTSMPKHPVSRAREEEITEKVKQILLEGSCNSLMDVRRTVNSCLRENNKKCISDPMKYTLAVLKTCNEYEQSIINGFLQRIKQVRLGVEEKNELNTNLALHIIEKDCSLEEAAEAFGYGDHYDYVEKNFNLLRSSNKSLYLQAMKIVNKKEKENKKKEELFIKLGSKIHKELGINSLAKLQRLIDKIKDSSEFTALL